MRVLTLIAAWLISLAVAYGATICIDPGHPSEIGIGTKGKSITEVQLCWDVAQLLKGKLEAAGHKVILTKSSVLTKVTNLKRATIANQAKADLMVRLHADYAPGESGFSTYYADRQGKDGKVTGPSKSVLAQVKPMAEAFHVAATQSLRGSVRDRGLKTDRKTKVGSERGALIGSIHSAVPSILVEMVVLNSPKDDAFAASQRGKEKLAEALYRGTIAALQARKPSA